MMLLPEFSHFTMEKRNITISTRIPRSYLLVGKLAGIIPGCLDYMAAAPAWGLVYTGMCLSELMVWQLAGGCWTRADRGELCWGNKKDMAACRSKTDDVYECEKCDKKFKSVINLKTISKSFIKIRNYTYCAQLFPSLKLLNRHVIAVHHNESRNTQKKESQVLPS